MDNLGVILKKRRKEKGLKLREVSKLSGRRHSSHRSY